MKKKPINIIKILLKHQSGQFEIFYFLNNKKKGQERKRICIWNLLLYKSHLRNYKVVLKKKKNCSLLKIFFSQIKVPIKV